MKEIFGILTVIMILVSGCTGTPESVAESRQHPSATSFEPAVCTADGDCGAVAGDDYVKIPISELSSTIKHYTYQHDESEVRYMAVLGSDGQPRIAFDACEVCWRAGKGYSQSGDSVTCNNCGLKFRIDELGEKNKGAGCWPAHIEHSVENGEVRVKKVDLADGAYFFS
ncbi:MAG: Fe-S-containing protein [Candidatus Micrarchaeota archaeon]